MRDNTSLVGGCGHTLSSSSLIGSASPSKNADIWWLIDALLMSMTCMDSPSVPPPRIAQAGEPPARWPTIIDLPLPLFSSSLKLTVDKHDRGSRQVWLSLLFCWDCFALLAGFDCKIGAPLSYSCNLLFSWHVPSGIGWKWRRLLAGGAESTVAKIPKSCHAHEDAFSPAIEQLQSQFVEEGVHNLDTNDMVVVLWSLLCAFWVGVFPMFICYARVVSQAVCACVVRCREDTRLSDTYTLYFGMTWRSLKLLNFDLSLHITNILTQYLLHWFALNGLHSIDPNSTQLRCVLGTLSTYAAKLSLVV